MDYRIEVLTDVVTLRNGMSNLHPGLPPTVEEVVA